MKMTYLPILLATLMTTLLEETFFVKVPPIHFLVWNIAMVNYICSAL